MDASGGPVKGTDWLHRLLAFMTQVIIKPKPWGCELSDAWARPVSALRELAQRWPLVMLARGKIDPFWRRSAEFWRHSQWQSLTILHFVNLANGGTRLCNIGIWGHSDTRSQ